MKETRIEVSSFPFYRAISQARNSEQTRYVCILSRGYCSSYVEHRSRAVKEGKAEDGSLVSIQRYLHITHDA